MSEIQNLVFWWRVIKLWLHATVTPCDETPCASQLFCHAHFLKPYECLHGGGCCYTNVVWGRVRVRVRITLTLTLTPRHYYGVWQKLTVILLHLTQFDMVAVSGWGGIHPSVRHSKNKTVSVSTRWRCNFKSWFMCRWPGLLSYMSSSDSIGPCMSEIQKLVFWWRVIKLWRHGHTVWRKSIFELVFIISIWSWSDENPGTSSSK